MEEQNKVKEFFASNLGRVIITAVSIFIIYGIMLLAVATDVPAIAIVLAVVCGYFGWRALSRITPNIFLIMPVVGWLIYYGIKGVLAIMIGCFIAPFQIGKMLSDKIHSALK